MTGHPRLRFNELGALDTFGFDMVRVDYVLVTDTSPQRRKTPNLMAQASAALATAPERPPSGASTGAGGLMGARLSYFVALGFLPSPN